MIERPNRLDKCRKELIKQLNNNMAKQALLLPKRQPQNNSDYQILDAVKKKHHTQRANVIGLVYSEDKKVFQKQFTSNEIFLKIQQNLQKNNQFNKKVQEINQNNTVNEKIINNNQQKLSLDPFFNNKMLDFGLKTQQELHILSQKQKFLVSFQQKLDDYLNFLKQYRKKKKGQLFGLIKKHFLQNFGMFIEFGHIKKINYLCQNYYSISPTGSGIDIDCLIDIQRQKKQNSLEQQNKTAQSCSDTHLKSRKQKFKQKIQEYVLSNRNQQNQSTFQIAQVYYDFQKKWVQNKTNLKNNVKQMFNGQLLSRKIDKFFVLNQKNTIFYKQSKKLLTKGIKKVQTLIQKQQQLDITLLAKKMFIKKILTQKQIQTQIEQIKLIFYNKNVTNILKSVILQNLLKKIILGQQIVSNVFQLILKFSLQINKNKPFIKQINHKNGLIIQYDKNSSSQFCKKLLQNQNWSKQFEFESQMNQKQKQKILQQQRMKIIKQGDQQRKDKQKYSDLLNQVKQQKNIKIKQFKQLEQFRTQKINKLRQQKKKKLQQKIIQNQRERSSSSDSKSSQYSNGSENRRKQFQLQQKQKNNKKQNHNLDSQDQDQIQSLSQPINGLLVKQQFRNTLQQSQEKQKIYYSQQDQIIEENIDKKQDKSQIRHKNNKPQNKNNKKNGKQQNNLKEQNVKGADKEPKNQMQANNLKNKQLNQSDQNESDPNVEWGKKYRKPKNKPKKPKQPRVKLVRQRW